MCVHKKEQTMDNKERNIVEITKDELQRLQGVPPNDSCDKFLREKLRLKALSDERAQRWPNTIKALHMKRLQSKQEELDKLEQARLKLDVVEAALKAKERRKQIERANKMLLLPHMKTLMEEAQVKNIIQERNAQIQYKKKMEEAWKRQDKRWNELENKQLEVWKDEEKIKDIKKKETIDALHKALVMQLDEHNQKLLQEKRIKELEKEELKRLLEEDHKMEEHKEEIKRKRIMEVNQEMIEGNKAQEMRKQEEMKRLKQLDEKIIEFAAKKDQVLEERKKLEVAKIALRVAQRDAMMEKQNKALIAARMDVQKRFHNEENEKRFEEDKKERMRIETKRKEWEECDRSRKMQVLLRKTQKEKQQKHDRYEAKKSWQRCWQIKKECEDEEKIQYLKNKNLEECHKQEIANKILKDRHQREEAIEEERLTFKRMKDDEFIEFPLGDLKI